MTFAGRFSTWTGARGHPCIPMISLARRSEKGRLVCPEQNRKRVHVLVQGVPRTGRLHVGTLSQPVQTAVGGSVKTRGGRFASLTLPHSCREMSARQFRGPQAAIPSMVCRQLAGGVFVLEVMVRPDVAVAWLLGLPVLFLRSLISGFAEVPLSASWFSAACCARGRPGGTR